jgi:hypothetical protein
MKLITDVGASAAQQGDDTFTRDQFITGVLCELPVCLCRRNANIEHAVSGCFVRRVHVRSGGVAERTCQGWCNPRLI